MLNLRQKYGPVFTLALPHPTIILAHGDALKKMGELEGKYNYWEIISNSQIQLWREDQAASYGAISPVTRRLAPESSWLKAQNTEHSSIWRVK